MKKRVLILHYSQSGQLGELTTSIAGPLVASDQIDVVFECLKPVTPYPFPWPFLRFFDTFPETVHADPNPIEPLPNALLEADFDLIILAYQVWFLAPAQPIMALLQSPQGARLLQDKPVITVIGCRNMWLMAQEKMKEQLVRVGAHLIDNVVLTDPAGAAFTFYSTPMWVLTGNKGPYWGGLIPAAGISSQDLKEAQRFGHAIAEQLPSREATQQNPMLQGLGAVTIRENLMASERIAIRSFRIWGNLLRALGKPGTLLRRAALLVYIVFLILMILTVVPITTILNRLLATRNRERTKKLRNYYAAPSGEGCNKVASGHD